MNRIIRLTEQDLARIVRRVISEDVNNINPKILQSFQKLLSGLNNLMPKKDPQPSFTVSQTQDGTQIVWKFYNSLNPKVPKYTITTSMLYNDSFSPMKSINAAFNDLKNTLNSNNDYLFNTCKSEIINIINSVNNPTKP